VDGAAAVATVATEHWRTGAAAAVAALDAALLAALITEGAGNPAAGMGVVACMGRAEIHRGLDSWDDGPLQVRVRQATPGRVTEVDLLAADGLRYARLKEIVVHRADDAAAADSPNGAAMSSPDSVRMSLVEVLAEVLPGFVDAPAMDTTPFVDLGMDSLLAAEVRRRLEHRLGVRMSLSMFWRHPTIPEMVAALGEQAAAAADEAEPHTSALTDLLSVLDDHAHEGGDR
jgi:acyl carrier protein